MPKNKGVCLGYMERFYYDSAIKQCVEFAYGGCDGNKNNFLTKQECEHRCNYDLVLKRLLKSGVVTTKQPTKKPSTVSTTKQVTKKPSIITITKQATKKPSTVTYNKTDKGASTFSTSKQVTKKTKYNYYN